MAQLQLRFAGTHPSMARRRAVVLAGLALAAVGVGAVAPLPATAQTSLQTARARLDSQRGRERVLAGHVAAFSTLINRLGSDIAVLQRRQGELEAALDTQRVVLDRIQRALRRERARLAALRARLAFSRNVLSRRLVEMYKAGRPDLVSVVVTSRGWVDLLERGDFLRRINQQDKVIVRSVRAARNAVALSTARLALLETRQREIAQAILGQRNQVAATRFVLDRKRAGVSRARADAQATLSLASARRDRLQSRLSALEAEQSKLTAQNSDAGSLGALNGWAIPWSIVRCESGGRNTGPNFIGASGYYQIIPSTWRGAGGRGPAAYLAPKSEQDRVAAQLYNHGAGARNWVCAGM